MEKKEIREKVLKILEENGVFCESDDDKLEGIDSLTLMSVLVDFENSFDMLIPEDKLIERFENVGAFVKLVCDNIGNAEKLTSDEGGDMSEKT